MKIWFLLVSILLMSVTQLFSAANDTLFAKIKGEWAEAGWVKIIKENHSPRTAAMKKRAYVTQVIISEKGGQYWLECILSHGHESTGPMPFRQIINVSPNEYLLCFHGTDETEDNEYTDTISTGNILLVGKDSMMVLSSGLNAGLRSDTLVRLGSPISSFVNNNTVVGNYCNDKGERYVFHSNGTVDWNKEQYQYVVQIDYVEIGNDCIIVMPNNNHKEDKWYGFKVSGKTLFLYDMDRYDDAWQNVEPPIMKLIRKH